MQDIKTFFHMIYQVIFILNREQRKKCILVFFATFIGAIFETLGVSAIIPFIQSIMMPDALFSNKYLSPIITLFHIQDTDQLILLTGIGIIIVYLLKNAYLIFLSFIQAKFRTSFLKDVSIRLLTTYMERPYTFFLNTNSSEIMQGINGDSHSVYDILDTLFKITSECLTVLLIALYIILMDPFMAICMLALAVGVFLVVTLVFKKRISALGDISREASVKQYRHIYQAISGIKEVKVMQRAENFIDRYKAVAEVTRKTSLGLAIVNGMPERLIETLCISGLIITVCVKLKMGVNVNSFVPKLASFAIAAFRVLPSISRITGYVSTLVFYRKYLDIAYQNFHTLDEMSNDSIEQKLIETESENTEAFQCVQIKDIYWKYNQTQKYVLESLSLTVNRGEAIAFIGPSGAGKTTLADVFLGLLPPSHGTIEIDGMDIYRNPIMWSRVVGYVPQTVFLTDDTLRANISFGIPEDEIDDEKVWSALEQAQLKEFVNSLPNGIETIVGERGVKFSGGQRQRVAIARALYNDPQILVLDEATSALDNDTEAAVMEAIDSLQGHKTLIIVAHRLSTIRNCNKIYEIRDGKATLKEKSEVFG